MTSHMTSHGTWGLWDLKHERCGAFTNHHQTMKLCGFLEFEEFGSGSENRCMPGLYGESGRETG